ncbi:MAG: GntR family transcriptional regulator [Prevotellaceae bacterium]|nr:GntR family transcriptional regulator [Prevotellaceae bacterium]
MKLTLNHASPVPLYLQIEKQLRCIIQSDDYKNGKKFPNEVDLSRQLGISRATLRQAMNKLVFEGLLVRKKGVGTVVADTAITSKAHNWLSFSQEMKAMGIVVKNYSLYIGWENPNEELCRFFHIPDGAKILKMERLRGKPEHPFVYFISYFNPRIGMTGNEDFSRPLYDILAQKYNTVVKLSKEEISAKAADRILAEKLEINVGDPILKRKRFVYDAGNHPVEWNVGYYRADSFVYTIEAERQ